jgi:hypothetical protein
LGCRGSRVNRDVRETGFQVQLFSQRGLFHIGEQVYKEAPAPDPKDLARGGIPFHIAGGREPLERIVEVVKGQAELFEVVDAGGSAGRFPGCLNGR